MGVASPAAAIAFVVSVAILVTRFVVDGLEGGPMSMSIKLPAFPDLASFYAVLEPCCGVTALALPRTPSLLITAWAVEAGGDPVDVWGPVPPTEVAVAKAPVDV